MAHIKDQTLVGVLPVRHELPVAARSAPPSLAGAGRPRWPAPAVVGSAAGLEVFVAEVQGRQAGRAVAARYGSRSRGRARARSPAGSQRPTLDPSGECAAEEPERSGRIDLNRIRQSRPGRCRRHLVRQAGPEGSQVTNEPDPPAGIEPGQLDHLHSRSWRRSRLSVAGTDRHRAGAQLASTGDRPVPCGSVLEVGKVVRSNLDDDRRAPGRSVTGSGRA